MSAVLSSHDDNSRTLLVRSALVGLFAMLVTFSALSTPISFETAIGVTLTFVRVFQAIAAGLTAFVVTGLYLGRTRSN